MSRRVFEDIDEREFEREDKYRNRQIKSTKNERVKEIKRWTFFKSVWNIANNEAEKNH